MTWQFLLASHSVAAAFGAIIAGAWMHWQRRSHETAKRELSSELRGAVDLEPCEFSYGWAEATGS